MIFDHQKPAFEKLLGVAQACFYIQRDTFKIKPRTNTLIVGSSGVGKSHIARAIASQLGVEMFNITVSEWILLGSAGRGAKNTWPQIFDFLLKNYKAEGSIILIDEVDKTVSRNNSSSWDRHVSTEIFRLLDLEIPHGIKDDDDCAPSRADQEKATDTLKNRTLILAAGAFQSSIWDRVPRPHLGFGADNHLENVKHDTNLTHLAETLPRELVNRFRAELVVLHQLAESDYHVMLSDAVSGMPKYLRETFLRLGRERIKHAVLCKQGCRFIEELVLDTVIAERSFLTLVKERKIELTPPIHGIPPLESNNAASQSP